MNRKQLTLILALVVVLGGLGWWLRQRSTTAFHSSEGRMGQKVLGDFDVNSVAQVTLQRGTNTLTLVRQDDRWNVRERGGYAANFSEVSDLLRKLWELKVIEPQTIGASQLGRLELLAPGAGEKSGTLIELKGSDGKVIRSVLLGKKHERKSAGPSPYGGDEGFPDGRYVMLVGQSNAVSLVSEPFSSAEPNAEQWLNKDFFKIEKVKSVAVTYPAATNSWKLERTNETSELKLADATPEEKLDPSKASGIPNALAFPSFKDVVLDPKPEQTGLDSPVTANFETFDGFNYTVKVGKKLGEEDYYTALSVVAELPKERQPGKDEKPEDKDKLDKEFKEKNDKLAEKLKAEQALGKWVYLVPKYTLDSVLKDRKSLMVEPKPAGGTNTPPAGVALPGMTPDPADADEKPDAAPVPEPPPAPPAQ
jgi:hypothetical protein